MERANDRTIIKNGSYKTVVGKTQCAFMLIKLQQ